jgi:uncharacterized damage-inducible protein DinB
LSTEYIRTLYQYSAWANGRILDTAAGLAPGQLTEGAGASYGSVRDTLVHTMSAQWIWLQRWKGVSPRAMLRAGDFPDLGAIRTHWVALERETRDFVEGLDEAQLARVLSYTNTRGQEWAYPLWQMLIHQVNHATQHRSEAALLLTQMGHSPGDLDLLVYMDAVNARKDTPAPRSA